MTKADLMKLVGQKVHIYFKCGGKDICGKLGFVEEFSEKYDYRKPNYFYINHTLFKVSHVRKIEIEEKGDDADGI